MFAEGERTTGFVACWSAPAGRRLHEPTEFAVPRSPSVDGRSGAHLVPRFPFLLLFSLWAFFFSLARSPSSSLLVRVRVSPRDLHRRESDTSSPRREGRRTPLSFSFVVHVSRVSSLHPVLSRLARRPPGPRYRPRTLGGACRAVGQPGELLLLFSLHLFCPSGTLVPVLRPAGPQPFLYSLPPPLPYLLPSPLFFSFHLQPRRSSSLSLSVSRDLCPSRSSSRSIYLPICLPGLSQPSRLLSFVVCPLRPRSTRSPRRAKHTADTRRGFETKRRASEDRGISNARPIDYREASAPNAGVSSLCRGHRVPRTRKRDARSAQPCACWWHARVSRAHAATRKCAGEPRQIGGEQPVAVFAEHRSGSDAGRSFPRAFFNAPILLFFRPVDARRSLDHPSTKETSSLLKLGSIACESRVPWSVIVVSTTGRRVGVDIHFGNVYSRSFFSLQFSSSQLLDSSVPCIRDDPASERGFSSSAARPRGSGVAALPPRFALAPFRCYICAQRDERFIRDRDRDVRDAWHVAHAASRDSRVPDRE